MTEKRKVPPLGSRAVSGRPISASNTARSSSSSPSAANRSITTLIDAFDIRAFILDTTLSSAPVRPSKYAYVPLADPAAQKTFYLCCQTKNERYIPQLVKK